MSSLPQHFPLVKKAGVYSMERNFRYGKNGKYFFVGFMKPEPCSRFRFHQSIFMIEMSVIRSLFFPPSSSLSLSLLLSFPPFPLNMIRIQYCSTDACVYMYVAGYIYQIEEMEKMMKWIRVKRDRKDGRKVNGIGVKDGQGMEERREDWKGRKRGNVL